MSATRLALITLHQKAVDSRRPSLVIKTDKEQIDCRDRFGQCPLAFIPGKICVWFNKLKSYAFYSF
jgi:hypothetical protein